jgi:GNAT superfamily N-acetyltransferase
MQDSCAISGSGWPLTKRSRVRTRASIVAIDRPNCVKIEYLVDRREVVPALANWLHAEWGHLRPGETVADRAHRIASLCGHRQIPTVFVATEGDQLLGSASLVEHDMETRQDLTPWLAGVFVLPEYRRRGIGAALVKRVVEEARSLAVARLYLYTPGSGAFYLRLGWSVVERTFYRSLWGDQELMIMKQELGRTVTQS